MMFLLYVWLPLQLFDCIYAKYNNLSVTVSCWWINKTAVSTIKPISTTITTPCITIIGIYIDNFSNIVVLCTARYVRTGQANMDIAGSVDDLHARLAIIEASEWNNDWKLNGFTHSDYYLCIICVYRRLLRLFLLTESKFSCRHRCDYDRIYIILSQ